MLFLTILATIVMGFNFIDSVKRGYDLTNASNEPGLTFIGALIGLAIAAVPVVALWVLYCRV